MKEVLSLLTDNAVALGVFVAATTATFNFIASTRVHRSRLKQLRFKNYHSLIDRLNEPETGAGHPLLDKQRSAIFEMRFYPEYRQLTAEILTSWMDKSVTLRAHAEDTLRKLKVISEGDR